MWDTKNKGSIFSREPSVSTTSADKSSAIKSRPQRSFVSLTPSRSISVRLSESRLRRLEGSDADENSREVTCVGLQCRPGGIDRDSSDMDSFGSVLRQKTCTS